MTLPVDIDVGAPDAKTSVTPPTAPTRSLDDLDLPFWGYALGLASLLTVMLGFCLAFVGAAASIPLLLQVGALAIVAGVGGFVALALWRAA